MRSKLVQDRLGRIATLLLSFVLPFLYLLASDLIWQVGKQLPGSVEDTALFLPSALPLIGLLCLAWLVGFVLCRYQSCPLFTAQQLANLLAVLAFLLAFLLTQDGVLHRGLAALVLHPEQGLTNLFPIRLALAITLAFGISVLVGYRAMRADRPIA
jgi:hypothetical protein